MTTTTLTKTAAQALLAHTQQATAAITVGSAVDVSSKVGPATALVKMGRTVSTALTNEVKFRLEVSAKTSGTDEWVPLYEWSSANGKTAAAYHAERRHHGRQHHDTADIWHRLYGGRLVLHPRNWHAGQQRVVA